MGNSYLLSVVILTPDPNQVNTEEILSRFPADTQLIICHCKQDNYAPAPRFHVGCVVGDVLYVDYCYYNFERHFSFSEARNYATEVASGKWVLHLDSDEIPANTPEFIGDYVQALTESDAVAAWVSICGVGVLDDNTQLRERYCMPNLRLYKNGCGIRWQGICHETIDMSVKDKVQADSEIMLYHSGYEDKEVVLKKCERNARLMVREYMREPSERNWNYLKKTFFNLKGE